MTAQQRFEEYAKLGQDFWDNGNLEPLVEFFKELKKLPRAEQIDFFLWASREMDDALRPDLETGIQYSMDFYPRADSSFFPSFRDLLES